VTRFCREVGISRSRFYEIRALAKQAGAEEAMVQRRRPVARSPLAIPVEVEELAVRLRKELADAGWDHGPISVRYRLQQMGIAAPVASTLARVFARRGMVVPQPQKRPRSSYRRFEAPLVHACWQLDTFQWPLADPVGSIANIYQLLDDKSRFLIASHVEIGETTRGALTVLGKGIAAFQVPHRLLSDNGTAFNQTRMGRRSQLVEHLQTLGCKAITGKPGHPQTQGKDERVHATTQRWLRAQPQAQSLSELQTQIDDFDNAYNHDRPHQALAMRTPAQALSDGPTALAPIPPLPPSPPSLMPVSAKTYKTDSAGRVHFHRISVNLSRKYARIKVTVVRNGDTVSVFDPYGALIRSQQLRPGQHYYGAPQDRDPRPSPGEVSTLT
jgi:putative transposase